MANRQRAFCFRLDQEREACSFYFWLTLQYSDEYVPHDEQTGEMCFSKKHCRDFFEKIRKRYSNYKFKHFLVSEYGPHSTHRPHYHCLLLCYSNKSLKELINDQTEMRDFLINKAWTYGYVFQKSFHGRVLSYLTKYCCKPEVIGQFHKMKPFTLISKGIGLNYLENMSERQKQQMIKSLDFTVRYGSGKIQLPRYYVDKIVPHSLQNLKDAIDTPDYETISSIRRRLGAQQTDYARRSYNDSLQKYNGDVYAENRSKEIMREATWSNFKSKVKNRKDL